MPSFTCNICGAKTALPDHFKIHRELFLCSNCNSCARFRGVVLGLFIALDLPLNVALCDLPTRKEVRGCGLSDDARYSSHLSRIFDYTNTFYHTEPRLDISKGIYGSPSSHDFIVCSEVLEHVVAPVNDSLANLLEMLKPGGYLILSVPYLEGYDTIEHFPHLHEYQVVQEGDTHVLLNTTRNGTVEKYATLVFHGGPGTTLEMRVFGEGDLLSRLHYVGFHDTTILPANRDDIGYKWPFHSESPLHGGRRLKSQVILTRRPA